MYELLKMKQLADEVELKPGEAIFLVVFRKDEAYCNSRSNITPVQLLKLNELVNCQLAKLNKETCSDFGIENGISFTEVKDEND